MPVSFILNLIGFATGGANKLAGEKMGVLFGREIYYLCDADATGRNNSSIKRLQEYKQNYKVIDLFPERYDKSDLADYILKGLRPAIIKSVEGAKTETAQNTKAPEKRKNISDFEKVENFLSDRYEIHFNEVSNEIEFRSKGEKTAFEVLNENDIYIGLQKNFINFSQAKVAAVLRSKFVTRYNPFQDYFDSLGEWANS